MAAARPLVAVQIIGDLSAKKDDDKKETKAEDKKEDAKSEQLSLPAVLLAPIRPDIVRFVHTSMNKNNRQPYAVSEKAGHQHSAESWGTGRAVARVPRVSGGGTSRAGQGAFANMCRKGRMYAPTKIWRKWHRKINTNQKRFAVASALAASALPALVMARGHRIDKVAEIPLVVDSSVESVKKTKEAIKVLEKIGAYDDVEKAKASRKIRRGVGKMRNRRHVQRRGPLVVFSEDNGVSQAFRNLPGVELANVERLNLLQLAPGGHLGRFIVWTRGAFDKLNELYGSVRRPSTQKKGWTVPRNIMANSDLTRLINSDEVQSKIRPAIKGVRRTIRKKNPLVNLGALVKLNPYALSLRRSSILAERRRTKQKTEKLDAVREKATQRAAAVSRTHDVQQRENYKFLIQGEAYRRPVDEKGEPVQIIKPQEPRAAINPVVEKKGEKKKKVKKVKKATGDEGKESKVASKFILPAKLPKIAAKKPPKVKKEKKEGGGKGGKGGKGDKGGDKEAAKGEAGKAEGKAAPKGEAKKEEKGKKGK